MEAFQAGFVKEFEGGFPGHSDNGEEAVESLREQFQVKGECRVVENRGFSSQHSTHSNHTSWGEQLGIQAVALRCIPI